MKLKALGPGALWDANLKSVIFRDSDLDNSEPDRRTAEVVKCVADFGQISEALFIANSEDDVLLNSGAEWGAGQVPRAAVARPV